VDSTIVAEGVVGNEGVKQGEGDGVSESSVSEVGGKVT